ncbi:hypothetical protein ACIA03_29830 [Nocardioides sp. NPDC051685]|uniref:hypothetical protein n=1 Tax=Nocardioides sp. NPDC051685 TaxID=3364334 RepID=UPI0037A2C867
MIRTYTLTAEPTNSPNIRRSRPCSVSDSTKRPSFTLTSTTVAIPNLGDVPP